jgi:histidine ammonia-lyase
MATDPPPVITLDGRSLTPAAVVAIARELGSLGTGDLTVLAEIGTALGGEGECWVGDEVVPAAEALPAHGLEPVRYGPRDGIAFMSSNAVSIGQAALVFHDATRLLDSALGVAALSYRGHGFEPVSAERKTALLEEYWTIPERQVETSVVLVGPPR